MLKEITTNIDELIVREQSSYLKSNVDILLKIKADILNMYEENLSLKEKISDLKNSHMVFENSVYFDKNEENPQPYCPLCWEKENLKIHLQSSVYPENQYECKNCKSYYFLSDAIILGTSKKRKK